jgi:hypothetical protein
MTPTVVCPENARVERRVKGVDVGTRGRLPCQTRSPCVATRLALPAPCGSRRTTVGRVTTALCVRIRVRDTVVSVIIVMVAVIGSPARS